MAYGRSQARSPIAISVSLYHSLRNKGSELCLRPTPQLMAMLDPWPTERGHRQNLSPHGCQLDSFPLHHKRNSGRFLILMLYYNHVRYNHWGSLSEDSQDLCVLSFFLLSFCLFRAAPGAYGGSQARGSNRSYSYQPTPQPLNRLMSRFQFYETSDMQCYLREQR